jgi:hypothetical protein
MTSFSEISALEWTWVGPRVVGAVLVWTGAIKAAAPGTFRRHLASLGLLPGSLLSAAVTMTAALETGLGTALIVGLAPGITLPGSIVLLLTLSLVSWWGVDSGKTADCGCYGGIIQPSIWQSLALNGLYCVLLIPEWITHAGDNGLVDWKVASVLMAAMIVAIVTEISRRSEIKTGRPLWKKNPLKIGARWRHRWANGATRQLGGEFLVSLLGPECPYCQQWVKVGNVIGQSPSLPRVVGVIGDDRKKIDSFRAEHGVTFTIARISPSLMVRLADVVPTMIHVVSGRISGIWVGQLPPDFVDRMRIAYFPNAAGPTE